ncbi:hypothetical protein BJV82DRAFT_616199 [Fennellomyces sp. T-0311]|nr:hypothetical protein BJV82DRAFT_616199 [Fennellomyces sp. T-0311]
MHAQLVLVGRPTEAGSAPQTSVRQIWFVNNRDRHSVKFAHHNKSLFREDQMQI